MNATCPVTSKTGKPVKRTTVLSLARPELSGMVEGRDWFYCDEPDCEVVYFAADGTTIRKEALKLRVGAKERETPRTVCYCFGHTIEGIEEEVAATGTSRVLDSIKENCSLGLDRCEETNPKGACCLGDVAAAIKKAKLRHPTSIMENCPGAADGQECCSPRTEGGRPHRRRGAGLWTTVGAVVTAALASACCWLPLLLVGIGASAAGVSTFFDRYRPLFLGSTAILLGVGFYLAYFRKERCGAGEACEAPDRRMQAANRAILWVAAALVLALALFPSYVGSLLRLAGGPPASTPGVPSPNAHSFEIAISGMDCEGCVVGVERAIAAVPGVGGVQVHFPEGRAEVTATPQASLEAVLEAIRRSGFEASRVPNKDETKGR